MSEEIKEEIENLSFEKKIEKAKELLEKLSNPQITLSDSLEVYKNGVKELEEAQKLLDEAKLIFTTKEKDSNEPF
ncbi:exodeoxyribonuclease VII small subunit [Halarcobacter sp.]|uniref:exodeoxyribonuclease VII small subunit n=1 Tax=Halarcobacter sp. TaxID=2321133 RepID=UPI002AA8FD27|nr:exodeoxyribonuclease VII small subunit [Halarcobacter sp.]